MYRKTEHFYYERVLICRSDESANPVWPAKYDKKTPISSFLCDKKEKKQIKIQKILCSEILDQDEADVHLFFTKSCEGKQKSNTWSMIYEHIYRDGKQNMNTFVYTDIWIRG